MLRTFLFLLNALALVVVGCSDSTARDGKVPFAGGDTTIVDRSSSAYSTPAPNLTEDDLATHLEGDVAFGDKFVSPPAEVNAGLGPVFNNNACAACHINDGRGMPVAEQGPLGSPLLVRVSIEEGEPSVPGGPVPTEDFGTQLQDHAIFGYEPEVAVNIQWVDVPGEYGDGEPYVLLRPVLDIQLANGNPLPADIMTSPRIPPPVFGHGLLEAVPEEDILALADPEDSNGDGISGRSNQVWDAIHSTTVLGRFGWKANVSDLLQQAAGAYSEDIGVSSPLLPEADGSSEIEEETLNVVTFYTQTLAVPQRDNWDDAYVLAGETLFRSIGCASCHVETLHTGDHEISALRDQTIHPYTDLLLHNMGFDLADGRPDFLASGTEWRTPPLWGIGLTQTVLPYSSFLHDGRARTLEEAILWHGGEAENSKEVFRTMDSSGRSALLAFLQSL